MEEIKNRFSFIKLKFYAHYMARLMGYELVGLREYTNSLSAFKLFPRNIPYTQQGNSNDPYIVPFSVDIDTITSRVGFSYLPGGWHPFVETLKEYLDNPRLKYEESSLKRLYDNFQPKNIQEVLLEHILDPVEPIYEWLPHNLLLREIWTLNPQSLQFYKERLKGEVYNSGWIFFGPHTEEYGKKEFSRLIEVFESVKRTGYLREKAIKDPVNGYFLKQGKEVRFVLLQGNHRVSALKVLGYPEVEVVIRKGHPAVIDKDELHKWTIEEDGVFTHNTAIALFDSLFEETGRDKAKRHNLISN